LCAHLLRMARMKKKEELPELAGSELDVMKVLWESGELSAREIHERVRERLDWAPSTTRTVLDRMVKKGLLEKRDSHGLNLYAARVSKAGGLARLVKDFAARVLELDHAAIVPLFARSKVLTREELEELSRLLEEGEGKGGKSGGRS
jgi:BlaI family transcriptional regulator, penicillinase repressor